MAASSSASIVKAQFMQEANLYLSDLADKLKINPDRQSKIDTSITYLKEKLWGIFQDKLSKVEVFGSYDRNTLLSNDNDADVDILIVFKENQFQPQTYLNQIRSFGEKVYPRSEIYPDHPTVAIEMNHIKFELVPAYVSFGAYKIPAPRRNEIAWISTSPKNFKDKVVQKDKANKGLIVPTIRLLKYWNYVNLKLFDSYGLEKGIIEKDYSCNTLVEYFLSCIVIVEYLAKTEPQKKAYKELLEKRRIIKVLEREKLFDYMHLELKRLLPSL